MAHTLPDRSHMQGMKRGRGPYTYKRACTNTNAAGIYRHLHLMGTVEAGSELWSQPTATAWHMVQKVPQGFCQLVHYVLWPLSGHSTQGGVVTVLQLPRAHSLPQRSA